MDGFQWPDPCAILQVSRACSLTAPIDLLICLKAVATVASRTHWDLHSTHAASLNSFAAPSDPSPLSPGGHHRRCSPSATLSACRSGTRFGWYGASVGLCSAREPALYRCLRTRESRQHIPRDRIKPMHMSPALLLQIERAIDVSQRWTSESFDVQSVALYLYHEEVKNGLQALRRLLQLACGVVDRAPGDVVAVAREFVEGLLDEPQWLVELIRRAASWHSASAANPNDAHVREEADVAIDCVLYTAVRDYYSVRESYQQGEDGGFTPRDGFAPVRSPYGQRDSPALSELMSLLMRISVPVQTDPTDALSPFAITAIFALFHASVVFCLLVPELDAFSAQRYARILRGRDVACGPDHSFCWRACLCRACAVLWCVSVLLLSRREPKTRQVAGQRMERPRPREDVQLCALRRAGLGPRLAKRLDRGRRECEQRAAQGMALIFSCVWGGGSCAVAFRLLLI